MAASSVYNSHTSKTEWKVQFGRCPKQVPGRNRCCLSVFRVWIWPYKWHCLCSSPEFPLSMHCMHIWLLRGGTPLLHVFSFLWMAKALLLIVHPYRSSFVSMSTAIISTHFLIRQQLIMWNGLLSSLAPGTFYLLRGMCRKFREKWDIVSCVLLLWSLKCYILLNSSSP